MATYAERPWTKYYDEGIPDSLMPYPEVGLHELLRDKTAENPQRPFLITSVKLPLFGRKDKTVTFGELDRASDAFGMALIEMGVKKGDRVAIVLPTCVAFAITYYAILKVGGVVVACNPTYPAPKMSYQINDCDAEIVISMSMFYDMIKSIQPETKLKKVIVTNIKEYFPTLGKLLFTLAIEKKERHYVKNVADGDYWLQDLLKKHDGQKPQIAVAADDLALFQYTGGTTGVSKGAMSTHRALVANMIQAKLWTASVAGPDGSYDDQLTLGALPFFHVYGIVMLLSLSATVGQRIVLVVNPRDIDELVDLVDVYKPTTFAGIPALFNAIVNHPRIKSGEVSLKSLAITSSGSAPLPPALQEEYEPLTGGPLCQGFGMSEAPTVTHSNPIMGERRINSIGLPWPDVDCRIVSLEDGESDLPVGESGELVMSAPNLMLGYHKMPDETKSTLREKDGKTWLYTGDIGLMDEDGYFYIVDRKKDMALIGGFNVYPTQIEKVLREHPAILEVGVVGIPHPERQGQEALKAWIVFKEGHSATEEELIEQCSKFLAPYEVPRRFVVVDELPKSAVGKVLRRELLQIEIERQNKTTLK